MDADQAGRQAVVGALMEAIAKLSGTAVTSAVPNPSESSSIGIMSRIGTTGTCINSGFRSSSGNTSLMTSNKFPIMMSRRHRTSQADPQAQPGSSRANLADGELRHLFHQGLGKRKSKSGTSGTRKLQKLKVWSHTFVCLEDPARTEIPSGKERAQLQLAGLGEKDLSLSLYGDPDDFHHELMIEYPKLAFGGGYELLRQGNGGRQLEEIPSPRQGYTTEFLKSVVHNAKVYIRPIQKSLDMSFTSSNAMPGRKEKCMNCDGMIPLNDLKEHVLSCNQSNQPLQCDHEEELAPYEFEEQLNRPPIVLLNQSPIVSVTTPASVVSITQAPIISVTSTTAPMTSLLVGNARRREMSPMIETHQQTSRLSIDDSNDNLNEYDDPVLQLALQLSSQQQKNKADQFRSIQEIVLKLQENIDIEDTFEMIIRRENVLKDSVNCIDTLSFDPRKKLNIEFAGENGIDAGGLTREFFRLFGLSFKSTYLDSKGCFLHNCLAYQKSEYVKLGILCAMSLAHGGGALPIFSQSTYNFLSGKDISKIKPNIDEISDHSVRMVLDQINEASNTDRLKEIVLVSSTSNLLIECGYTKAISGICDISDKSDIMNCVLLHKIIISPLGEMLQFKEGLRTLGVADMLKNNSEILKQYFCLGQETILTANLLGAMFYVKYSEKGRTDEEATYNFFLKYAEECEKGIIIKDGGNQPNPDEHIITLGTLVTFFTGSESFPPLGYENLTISFNNTDPFPTASTCAMELTLPTQYQTYTEFKSKMNTALLCYGGFGYK